MNAAPAQAFSDATPNQNPYSRAGTSRSIPSIPDFRQHVTESGYRYLRLVPWMRGAQKLAQDSVDVFFEHSSSRPEDFDCLFHIATSIQ
jgi:hypothetical protein